LAEASQTTLLPSTISTTTTSPALARVRGFTVDLLMALNQGPLRTLGICEKTQKPANYVSRYLLNMQKYGLVLKSGSFWNLTVLGESFVGYLHHEIEIEIEIRNLNERKKKEELNVNEKILRHVEIQSRLDIWNQKNTYSPIEVAVVDYLVSHYNRTKQKFVVIQSRYELAERLNLPKDDVDQALLKLYEDRVAYVQPVGHSVFKVALYAEFVENLEKDAKA